MKKIDTEKGPVAVLGQNDIRIEDVGAFLDLLGAADCDTIAIVKENLDPSFFELSSGFAGELLQKVSNYRKRLIIIGNFGNVESKSLRDFIYESNRNGQVIFASDLETALTMLS